MGLAADHVVCVYGAADVMFCRRHVYVELCCAIDMQQNIYNIGLVKQLAHILKSANILQMCPTESSVPFPT